MFLRAAARVLPAPDDGSEQPPLIFLPALGFTGHSFIDVTASLHAPRKRVLVDLPGIGDGPEADSVDCQDIIDAVAGAVDECDLGGRQPILVGHSIGGAIAVRLMAQQRSRFEALVLVDAPVARFRFAWWEHLAAHPALWAPLLRIFGAPWLVKMALPRVLHEPLVSEGWDLDELSRQLADPVRLRTMVGYYKAFLLPKQLDVTAQCLQQIHAPILILRGARDYVLSNASLVDAIAAMPEDTRVEVHIFAYGGHLLPLEAPQAVAKAIDTFLGELPRLATLPEETAAPLSP
jgi:pimeloyl-ACP methyl ester carboxylesterase